jgi:hypothetical protein
MRKKLLQYIRLGLRVLAVAAVCSFPACVQRLDQETLDCLLNCRP